MIQAIAFYLFAAVVLLAGVTAVLFFAVFPAVEPHLPYSDVTVNQGH